MDGLVWPAGGRQLYLWLKPTHFGPLLRSVVLHTITQDPGAAPGPRSQLEGPAESEGKACLCDAHGRLSGRISRVC